MKLIPYFDYPGGKLVRGSKSIAWLSMRDGKVSILFSINLPHLDRDDLCEVLFFVDKLEAEYGKNKTL